MANRIFIIIGLLAIAVLAAAFVVPRFIDWDAYKPRMEEMAGAALGTPVAIAGQMRFTLLPQPKLVMSDVRVGPENEAIGRVASVEADFSLMDFLRDRYQVTRLLLVEPEITLTVDAEGRIENPVRLAQTQVASNVSIDYAHFENGTMRLIDLRAEEGWEVTGATGEMRLGALRGPFGAQGVAEFEGGRHQLRVATSAMNAEGVLQVSLALRPAEGRFSVTAEGTLATGERPGFSGRLAYRARPEQGADAARGDFVLEAAVEADPDRVALGGLNILPDENRTGTRLTGAAALTLGAERSFEASISGGVVALAARDAREDGRGQPYELIRLLRELPAPPVLPLPGRIDVEIAELGLRAVAVREARLEAVSDGEGWTIETFSGRLPGDSRVALSGRLGAAEGRPAFEGQMALDILRLDGLATLWRRPVEGNPLFGLGGGLEARISLAGETLRIIEGRATLEGTAHGVEAEMRFGEAPWLGLSADLSALDARRSAALLAFLPPIGEGEIFGVSFPEGRLELGAAQARVLGQALDELTLAARWERGGVAVELLELGGFGGVGFSGSGRLAGTLAQPVIAADGRLSIAAGASALGLVEDWAGGPALGTLLRRNLPAAFDLELAPPGAGGVQSLYLEGRANRADLRLGADLSGGLTRFWDERIELTLEAVADSGEELFAQLGSAPLLLGEDGTLLSVSAQGRARGTLETEISVEGGGERLDFSGTLMLAEWPAVSGRGQTSFLLLEMEPLLALAGARGVTLPGVEGMAQLGFTGDGNWVVSDISAFLGDAEIGGELAYSREAQGGLLHGDLVAEALDTGMLARFLGGPAALVPGISAWPEGPLEIGTGPRQTRGRVAVATPALIHGEEALLEAVSFDLSWDGQEVRLRNLVGARGDGTVSLEAALCCAVQFSDKQLTGRFSLEGVEIGALVPEAAGAALSGRLTARGQFQGSGDSFAALMGSLSGDGGFSIAELAVAGLSPDAFAAAAGIENIVEVAPEALEAEVVETLEAGPFRAREAAGVLTITGGDLRVSNLAIEGEDGARLLGGGTLGLDDLLVQSRWTLSTTRPRGGNGLITESTGRIGVAVAGPWASPERAVDLSPMIDSIQMRAYELELRELERLRAADEARQRALAAERARLMEEEARRRAEELLRAEEERQAREAQEEEEARLEALEEMRERLQPLQPLPPAPVEPFTFSWPPPDSQPL